MRSSRSRRTVTVASFLSYLLVMLLCAPFAPAVSSSSSATSVSASTQEQPAAPHRSGELLVRFRSGVSQQDKDMVLATQERGEKNNCEASLVLKNWNCLEDETSGQRLCNCC